MNITIDVDTRNSKVDKYGFTEHKVVVDLRQEDNLEDALLEVLGKIPEGDTAEVSVRRPNVVGSTRYLEYNVRHGYYSGKAASSTYWYGPNGEKLTAELFRMLGDPLKDQRMADYHKNHILFTTSDHGADNEKIIRMSNSEFLALDATALRILHEHENYTFFEAKVISIMGYSSRETKGFIGVRESAFMHTIYQMETGFDNLLKAALANQFPDNDYRSNFYSDRYFIPLDKWFQGITNGRIDICNIHAAEEGDTYFRLHPGDTVTIYRNNWALKNEAEADVVVETIHYARPFYGNTHGTAFLCTVIDEDGETSLRWVPYFEHEIKQPKKI